MKKKAAKKTTHRLLKLTTHQACGLRSLLLAILDAHVEQSSMTEEMITKIYDQLQGIYGYFPYNKKERERAGYRRTPRRDW